METIDTNLILLITAVVVFVALVIFDFAFFRFREQRFEQDEPLSFLIQSALRRLRAWAGALQKPNSNEPFFQNIDSAQTSADSIGTNSAFPARVEINSVNQSGQIKSGGSVDDRPTVNIKISADIPQGTVVYITMEVVDAEGKVSIQKNAPARRYSATKSELPPSNQSLDIGTLISQSINQLKNLMGNNLHLKLFWGSIIAYALIISFAIDQFPIYFFVDEAIHMNMIADFLSNGFQNYTGEFLPTFFIKEGWVNGTSVYLQLLPYLMFGKSIIVTRLVSALITLVGAIAIGLLLKKTFKTKYYWAGLFLLLTTPAWFIHARTAFEYAEVASFYAIFLYFYSRYRKGDMRAFYIAIFSAALCFYTHGLGQILMGVTGLALLVVDFRYHIHPKRRVTILLGLGLAIILLLPFARYYLAYPTEIAEQVKRRGSYWSFSDLTFQQKSLRFLVQYFYGLNPLYWYFTNTIDFDRHKMLGFGDGLLITLPFMLIGFYRLFKSIRNVAHRIGIIALITVLPILLSTIIHTFIDIIDIEDGTWLTNVYVPSLFFQPAQTVSVNPPTFISADIVINALWIALASMLVGLLLAFIKIRTPGHKLALIALLACPVPASVAAVAMPRMLWMSVPLAILTTIGLSFVLEWVENRHQFKLNWAVPVGLFAALVSLGLFILWSALVPGPLWFENYGLYGLQYGAKQVFQDTVRPGLDSDPNISYIISTSWANGTNQFVYFFIPDELRERVAMGQPVDFVDNPDKFTGTLFVTTAEEFSEILRDPKFKDVNVIKNIPYPNGQPGFYVISLLPADNILEIMAAEHAANRDPIENVMLFPGQPQQIRVLHSPLSAGQMEDNFDDNPDSFTRVLEANPYYIDLYLETPIDTNSVFIKTGSLRNYTVTIRLYAPGADEPVEYVNTYQDEPGKDLPPDPEQTISFDNGPAQSIRIEIEVRDNNMGETSQIHLRTIIFK